MRGYLRTRPVHLNDFPRNNRRKGTDEVYWFTYALISREEIVYHAEHLQAATGLSNINIIETQTKLLSSLAICNDSVTSRFKTK